MTSKFKRDPKIEEFLNTLLIKKNVNYVEKVGLQDTSMNAIQLYENEIGVKEIFIFTNEGIQLLNTKFSRILDINSEKLHSKIQNLIIALQKIGNLDNNFNFHKIYLNGLKFIFMIKSYIVLCGIFSESGSSLLAKLYLYFIFSSISNYCNQAITKIDRSKMELLANVFALRDKNQLESIGKRDKIISNSSFEMFPIKFYQEYFVKPFTAYFNKICKFWSKKEDYELENIKFKNMYIVDPITKEILFDLLQIKKKLKNKKFFKNERVWSEIIYHANNLLNSYKNNVGMEFDSKQKANRFVKFESTSTFPRLTYIIKFLPVLKGLAVIHIYSQNKLSRGEFNESLKNNKHYKEVDILYGTETKENSNFEFKYTEPPKLTEIEDIFTELFISNYKNSEFFYRRSYKLVYFDDIFVNKINDLVLENPISSNIDIIYNKVNSYLYEIYSQNKHSMNNDVYSKKGNKEELRELNMYVSKEDIVREFFKGIDKKININKLDGTLNLSKIDDGLGYDINDISVDFVPKISFTENKEDDNLPSFIYVNNNNTSFSGILMKDWESRRQHNYDPIENSLGNNKLEIVNNDNHNVFELKINNKNVEESFKKDK